MQRQSLDKIHARAPLPALKPNYTPWVRRGVQILAPLYLRYALGIQRFEVSGGTDFIRLVDEFQQGRCRFAVAFRHPNVMDPQCVYYLFSNRAPSLAKRHRVQLGKPPHVAFLYGRGVPLWAGNLVGWILPRIGAMPVLQGASDAAGLSQIRKAYLNGDFPIALAPEGQVSYHNHRVDRVEPGPATLSMWCYEDLRAAGRSEEVYILPVAPIYRYTGDPVKRLKYIFSKIAGLTGFSATAHISSRESALSTLIAASDHLAGRLEAHYSTVFGYRPGESDEADDTVREVMKRFERIARYVLGYVEHNYGIVLRPAGDGAIVPRIFPVRRKGWNRTFREDLDLDRLSPVERTLADRGAVEAYLVSRHLELVDILAYFDVRYATESDDMNRIIEVALNLYDVASRCIGETIAGRLSLPSEVTMRIGKAIPVSSYIEGGAKSEKTEQRADRSRVTGSQRRARRDAIEEISGSLYTALEDLSVD